MKQTVAIVILAITNFVTLVVALNKSGEVDTLTTYNSMYGRYVNAQKTLKIVRDAAADREYRCESKEQYYSSDEFFQLKKAEEEAYQAYNDVYNLQ